MAIEGINSLSQAITVYNNPNTSKDVKRAILAKYPDVVKYVGNDTTKYEISDDDFDLAKAQGKQQAKDSTGYDGHKSYRAVVDAVTDVGANVAGMATKTVISNAVSEAAKEGVKKGTEKAINEAGKQAASEAAKAGAKGAVGKLVANTASKAAAKAATKASAQAASEKAIELGAEKAATEAGKKAIKEAGAKAGKEAGIKASSKVTQGVGKSVGCIVGCVLGLAEGTKYTASRPNKDQVEAANDLMANELPEGQETLAEAQSNMVDAEEEVTEKSEDAESAVDETNDAIDDDKTEFDFKRAQYNGLKSRVASGDKLTKEEAAYMKKLATTMEKTGDEINDKQEKVSDTVNEISDDIAEKQETFDEAAEDMANVEGVTEFAEGFDQNTQTMCYVESGVQGLNAAMSAKSSYQAFALASSGSWAFGATAWAYAFGVMGATGSLMSANGVREQTSWAKDVGNEIDSREFVQDINAQTNELYDTTIQTYADQIDLVDGLEIVVPDDLEVPQDQVGAAVGAENNSSSLLVGQNDNKDKSNANGSKNGARGTSANDATNNSDNKANVDAAKKDKNVKK